ncbi:O-antigen ligase family protein, partial [Candidatus Uhrbacteria bacterium]|nr:O-antigen ligase family protein [Candidatus Uhrbacteria bacterium]
MKKPSLSTWFERVLFASLLLFVVFIPSVYSPFQTPKTLGFYLYIELLLPFFLILGYRSQFFTHILKDRFTQFFLLFLTILTASSLLGANPWNSFFGNRLRMDGVVFWYHLFAYILYLRLAFDQNPRFARKFLYGYFITMSLLGVIAVLQTIGWIPAIDKAFTSRSTATFGNPSVLASVLIAPLFLALSFFKKQILHKQNLLTGSFILILIISIISTGTRGALIGIFLGALTYGLLMVLRRYKIHAKKIIGGIVLITLLSGAGLFLANPSLSIGDTSLKSRLIYWEIAIEGWVDAPILGVGHQNFDSVAERLYDPELYTISSTWPDKPHNIFLELLVTTGLLGLISYLLLLGTWISSSK